MPSLTRTYPVLLMRFHKLNGGLSLQNVYFQVEALVFNHTHKRMRDQGLFPNRLD